MTAFAIFALTTAGPVQIQRISRERAPLSMMVLGRGSERLAISDRYDDFVYPGGGPVEKFFGPFPEGGFRLEVSAPIDSGDSWQLAAFMAHAVVGAGQHSLCREVAEAERILCLTGTVDYDGQIGVVGHIAEKMQALDSERGQWGDGPPTRPVEPLVVVPRGEDFDHLAARDATPGLAVRGAGSVVKLCRELDIPLAPAGIAATDTPPAIKPETPRRSGIWKWSLSALVLLAAAIAVFSPESRRPPEQAPLPPPTAKREVAAKVPVTPTTPVAPTTPVTPPVTKAAAKKPAKADPPARKEPAKPAVPLTAEVKPPRLGILERHAPEGQPCTAVYFGKAQAELRPVPVADGDRFKTSQGKRLCGLLLRIELGGEETYAVVNLETLSGRLVGALRPPPDLSGRRLVKGRPDWKLDLPHGSGEPVRYTLSLIVGPTAIRHNVQPAGGRTISLHHEVQR
ncbi:MAG: hypothetical protein VCE74_22685 [Alphaproteobacteria bacterium]